LLGYVGRRLIEGLTEKIQHPAHEQQIVCDQGTD
jgi:hypothetical protein